MKFSLHTLRRFRFAFMAFVAVLCLLGVQQGAAFHGVSHLADESSQGPQKHGPHSKSCDKCVVYAELIGAAPTTTHASLNVPLNRLAITSAAIQSAASRTLPGYSARAPPHLL